MFPWHGSDGGRRRAASGGQWPFARHKQTRSEPAPRCGRVNGREVTKNPWDGSQPPGDVSEGEPRSEGVGQLVQVGEQHGRRRGDRGHRNHQSHRLESRRHGSRSCARSPTGAVPAALASQSGPGPSTLPGPRSEREAVLMTLDFRAHISGVAPSRGSSGGDVAAGDRQGGSVGCAPHRFASYPRSPCSTGETHNSSRTPRRLRP